MIYGLIPLPWWGYCLVTLVLTHITIVSVTIFLHRCQAHRSLDLHPVLSHFFRVWLWLTTGMMTRAWTAIHRKHHAKCETPEDPHSPQVYGLSLVLWQGTELYRKEAKCAQTMERFGKGTPDDWLERHVYTKHTSLGFKLMLLINLVCFGIPGITIWAVQMAWIPFFAAGVINGIGHFWGYRNYETQDSSTNISPWGILVGGEELHNNHHTYPTSAKFSTKWWEFDVGWLYIRLFSLLGLAKAKRTPPKVVNVPNKETIDFETLRALINNRFQVMTCYTRSVIFPIFDQERQKAQASERSIWKRVKGLLKQDMNTVDSAGQKRLEKLLDVSTPLNQVYQHKQQLQHIWNQTTASQKELIEALQKWCQEAEESGLVVLREFAHYLKGYGLKPQVQS